jgi:hypothetical protein
VRLKYLFLIYIYPSGCFKFGPVNFPEKTFPCGSFSGPKGLVPAQKKKKKLGQFSGSKPSGLSPQRALLNLGRPRGKKSGKLKTDKDIFAVKNLVN